MNILRINIQNPREGILTYSDSVLTMISDQLVSVGDIILHTQYTRVVGCDVNTIVVQSVEEERPSKGDWITTPSTYRRILFQRKTVSGELLKEKGYLRTELVNEDGKKVQKVFLQI